MNKPIQPNDPTTAPSLRAKPASKIARAFPAVMAIGVLVALLVIASVWWPILAHYRIESPAASPDVIRASRLAPPDERLEEIGALKHGLVPPIGPDYEDPVDVARTWIAEGGPRDRASLFDPEQLPDLDYAGLETLRVLMLAYAQSSDPLFLDTAAAFVVDFAEFDAANRLPTGLLWNDHAVGVRPVALGKFWRHYRNSASYDASTAGTLLNRALATAARLADPRHYTYASNHGTIQNLGLMHLALAFPELPGMPAYAELAIERHREQMAYLFGPEGAWRENSPGYHRTALELSGVFLRYMTLAGREIPADLETTYDLASAYYRAIRTPDGALPPLGDTSHWREPVEPLVTAFDDAGRALPMTRSEPAATDIRQRLFADLGQALWWSGDEREAQTVVTWSNFRRHGHKHADELSLNLRTRDGNWWTNVGYWPLDHEFRRQAQSWSASNAPHLADEPGDSHRESTLLGYGGSGDLAAIDLKRTGPGPFAVRRQVVVVDSMTWLAIDAFDDAQARDARIVWGVDHDIDVAAGPNDRSFVLSKKNGSATMHSHILSSGDADVRVLNGSVDPFAGWVELDYTAITSDAIVIDTRSTGSWVANVSQLDTPPVNSTPPAMKWVDAQNWQIDLPQDAGTITLRRDGRTLTADRNGMQSLIELADPPPPSPAVAVGDGVFARTAARSGGHFPDVLGLRKSLTVLLVVLLIGHLVAVLLLHRFRPGHGSALGLLAVVCWVAVAGWLHVVYPLGVL